MKNLLERVSHIVNFGKDYKYYQVYFKEFKDIKYDEAKTLLLNEDEFIALDNLFEGELACKVLN